VAAVDEILGQRHAPARSSSKDTTRACGELAKKASAENPTLKPISAIRVVTGGPREVAR